MDKSRAIYIDEQRFRNSEHHASSNHEIPGLERRDSNISTLSLMDKVQMAHCDVFSGPIGESVPSSLTSFAHYSRRADSNTSFSIFRNDEDAFMVLSDENAILDDEFEISDDENLISLESENSHFRTSPEPSEYDFLVRRHSTKTNSSHQNHEKRVKQKINIAAKDLNVAIVGFQTSIFGYTIYSILCCLSLGLGYLVLRWIPRWKVLIIGKPCPLYNCDWVVIENQWGEFITQEIIRKKYGHPISTVFGRMEKHHIHHLEDEDPILNELQMLEYRYMRFLFHPYEDKFILGDYWKDPRWTDIASIRLGIDGDERENRGIIFGKNSIEIEQKSAIQLLTDEVLHPFYVFQIGSLVLWSLDQYYYYAVCIFIISLFSIIKTLLDAHSTAERLRNISKSNFDIRVLRNSFWRHVESSELVPGDVFEVTDPALKQLPCDSLLLAGDCIVNESMLTGESVPISKSPTTLEALQNLNLGAASIAPEVAKHILFGGTKIIRAKRPLGDSNGDAVALAVVVRTGFNTVKGALVRSILFPKPSGFSFYRDSFRYISVMACIAFLGFIASFINFIRLQLDWGVILIRALDLITIVVPPALPATLTIGTNFALSRLKDKQIFCISPQRVNVGGKVNLMCFDKTGTLTEDGLDVLGIRIFQQAENRLSDLFNSALSVYSASSRDENLTSEYDLYKAAIYAMATCHSLRIIDNKIAGDPLDVNMFEFTGWSLEEGEQGGGYVDDDNLTSLYPTVARPPSFMGYESNYIDQPSVKSPVEIGILKTFEFVSHLRRVSVVVREFGSLGCDIYVKGAPECIAGICKSETLPPDFEEILAHYTHRGFRVIALATKHIMKLSWVKIQKMRRIEAESDLVFIGFLIFENKLKPNTTSVLNELARADIRKLMCTGDNILTAISVARECNLISPVGNWNSQDPKSLLIWESIDDSSFLLDETNLTPLPYVNEVDTFISHNISDLRDYSIAITGDVFRWVVDFAPEDILHKVLVYGQVFARMSPDDKSELVEKLQSIDYCCGFCGDGANDCSALKAADIGISLSEAEASVAAPFTSQIFDITCVPEVIREGRAALVTSFTCFKYMSLYSAIQFTSVSFLYASASNLGDFQFLFIDLILILPIAIFLGWTKSYPILHPKRPTANLVSGKVLTPLLGQVVISIIYQTIVLYTVREQTWFIPPHLDKGEANIINSENTVLFLLSCFEYILSGIVLSVGPPFQQTWTRNFPFVITIVLTLASTIFLLFNPSVEVANFMELTKLSLNFKFFIFLLGSSYFFVAWLSEKIILVRISDFFRKNKVFGKPAKRKIYKTVLENINSAL
ncbi:putative cation-transporting ATPase [Golovinomyces cichoracearum]|uniref:Cation-transporting ATPase n=1 Tax=Golovinomyces cichoracearum TaxID=62708 RepID=A0A420J6G7_9PEZI|nr:putative cation-transporting ATPase [Golovinomyces cichoracearum]